MVFSIYLAVKLSLIENKSNFINNVNINSNQIMLLQIYLEKYKKIS